jgi:hypothetical protein
LSARVLSAADVPNCLVGLACLHRRMVRTSAGAYLRDGTVVFDGRVNDIYIRGRQVGRLRLSSPFDAVFARMRANF